MAEVASSRGAAAFPKGRRLLKRRDFLRAQREGKGVRADCFVLIAAPLAAEHEAARVGIVASRKVGGAVVRNRVKRRVREWFRHLDPDRLGRWDYVVLVRPGAGELTLEETRSQLGDGLRRVQRKVAQQRRSP